MTHPILVIGAGPGGLALALALHRRGLPVRVVEAAPALKPVGLGINLLPHCTRVLADLGLEDALAARAVSTREAAFFNRFGQLIHHEPLGRAAGYDTPQFSIHRADLQHVLAEAFVARAGREALALGARATGVTQDAAGVSVALVDPAGRALPRATGAAAIACDGLHSALRKELHPGEGPPKYSGVNMWRGVTRWPAILSGATMIRAGWLATGKMVIYPIRDRIDGEGRQLVNWVAEIETPKHLERDWNRAGALDDFIGAFADWHFDWLDVPAFLRAADLVLEFPMIDQDPLPWWTQGRVTLLGDAAHPMYPRGSNGAGQAILDAAALADCLAGAGSVPDALGAYEAQRLAATANVVRMNRSNPPDAILREVFVRTGDRPFANIDDVISKDEIMALSDGYKRVAGYDRATLARPR